MADLSIVQANGSDPAATGQDCQVYLAWKGGGCLAGVFSSKQNADLFLQYHLTNWNVSSVDPPEPVDPGIPELLSGLKPYRVSLSLETGEPIRPVEFTSPWGPICNHWLAATLVRVPWQNVGNQFGVFYEKDNPAAPALHAAVWAKDGEHALTIVRERRLKFVAAHGVSPLQGQVEAEGDA